MLISRASSQGDASEAYDILRRALFGNLKEYVRGAVGNEAAQDIYGDAWDDDFESLDMFVWAAVQQGCTSHALHHHSGVVSGVVYLEARIATIRHTTDCTARKGYLPNLLLCKTLYESRFQVAVYGLVPKC